LFEFGRTIRITCRVIARNINPPVNTIAFLNLRGYLKSKDNTQYRWCC